MVARLPDELVAHRGNYWRIGHNLLQNDQHWQEHLDQIKAALAGRSSGCERGGLKKDTRQVIAWC